MNRQSFSVDAALLRELGERLIGRAPIALAELIKNSYDADASTCRIEFSENTIVIADDGRGMSEEEFQSFWMRIGTTHRAEEMRSPSGRPLTGSKGIGRLSVQFLADETTLETTSVADPTKSLYALVDWRKAKKGENLETVDVLWEARRDQPPYPNESRAGTRITLTALRNSWDAEALETLGREVWRLRPPFRRTRSGSALRSAEDFDIEVQAPLIAGAREAFDKVRAAVLSNWKARIEGNLEGGRMSGKAAVTLSFRKDYPENADEAATYQETVALPVRTGGKTSQPLVDRAKFEILIFKTEGLQPAGVPVAQLREYLTETGNVSVYDTGFRLPYYGSGRDAAGQDWLQIALDQGRRLSRSELLPSKLQIHDRYLLDLPAPSRILGSVEIDTNHERDVATKSNANPGEWLQIQPGRDRLHDNAAFAQLRDLVRFSLDLYASRYRLRSLKAIERSGAKEPASKKYDRVLRTLERNRSGIPSDVLRDVRKTVIEARKAAAADEGVLDKRAALLAPLATAGMSAIALSHELARETRLLEVVGERLHEIAEEHALPELAQIAEQFDQARARLETLRNLFSPLASEVDTEALDRLRVSPIVEHVVQAIRVLMPRVSFDTSKIKRDLRFPVGAFSEWNALLQNALTNSWNAMLESDELLVAFHGDRDKSGREWLRVSDTGQGLDVPLDDSGLLFEPFERRIDISKDKRSVALGGQGLGLAIVRMIANRRSAAVRFVAPEKGFATTLELSWKGQRK